MNSVIDREKRTSALRQHVTHFGECCRELFCGQSGYIGDTGPAGKANMLRAVLRCHLLPLKDVRHPARLVAIDDH
jgi:hypothetical protein